MLSSSKRKWPDAIVRVCDYFPLQQRIKQPAAGCTRTLQDTSRSWPALSQQYIRLLSTALKFIKSVWRLAKYGFRDLEGKVIEHNLRYSGNLPVFWWERTVLGENLARLPLVFRQVVFNLLFSRSPRCNYSSTLYSHTFWYIIQVTQSIVYILNKANKLHPK
jgi:hypothetical protein